MQHKPFIPKQDPNIPDFYTVEINFHDGKKEEIKIVDHKIIDKVYEAKRDAHGNVFHELVGVSNCPFYEFVTHEDTYAVIPVSSIKSLKFGKDFTKFMNVKNKIEVENADT